MLAGDAHQALPPVLAGDPAQRVVQGRHGVHRSYLSACAQVRQGIQVRFAAGRGDGRQLQALGVGEDFETGVGQRIRRHHIARAQ
ncbi:hypothetical protein D3C80_1324300 [compost metagenome]